MRWRLPARAAQPRAPSPPRCAQPCAPSAPTGLGAGACRPCARTNARRADERRAGLPGSAPDVVKTDEDGRKAFLKLADELESIQQAQLQQEGCSTSMVRGAAAVCRFAQIGLKRSKQIAQGGNSFSVKDFIKHLQTRFPAQDENGESSGIDWKKNSEVGRARTQATAAATRCPRSGHDGHRASCIMP